MYAGKTISLAVFFLSVAFGVWVWARYLTTKAKMRSAATVAGGEEYRRLADEYRRLSEIAITAEEHTDLKLGDLSIRIEQLHDQLDSVQRILKDVE